MLSAIALTLALAFWAPYGGAPSCETGVQIHVQSQSDMTVLTGDPRSIGAAYYNDPECNIWVSDEVVNYSVPGQCAVLAHELGHLKGLEHSPDPRNVMFPDLVVPRGCEPKVDVSKCKKLDGTTIRACRTSTRQRYQPQPYAKRSSVVG